MTRTAPRARMAAHTVVPLVAGATAASAGVLLLGWPQRPPLPGQPGLLAAVAVVTVAVLLVFVPALPTWRRSDLAREHAAPVRARVTARAAPREVLEPAR